MKKILLILFIAVSVKSIGQADSEKQPLLMGDGLYTFTYEDIKGNPFLKDEWWRSTIVMNNKKEYANVMLKMDLYQNNFVFNRDNKNFILTPDVTEVKFNTAAPAELKIFRRGYSINKFIKPGNFVQVLADGKTSLLKFIKKDMEEYTEYNDATKYKRFKVVELYFIMSDNQFTQVNLTKKNMETVFQSKWAQMDAYLKQNNISGRDEKGWAAAVNYYNSL